MIDGKALFATDTLHTRVSPARFTDTCRVCGNTVRVDERVYKRQHFLDVAHVACGWLKRDEADVHEVRRPGTSFAFFEWRCPTCELDACHTRRPLDGDDLRCKRCRPRKLAEGGVAELVIHVRSSPLSTVTGRRFRAPVVLEPGTRVRVRELREGASYAVVVPLAWRSRKAVEVRTLALSPV